METQPFSAFWMSAFPLKNPLKHSHQFPLFDAPLPASKYPHPRAPHADRAENGSFISEALLSLSMRRIHNSFGNKGPSLRRAEACEKESEGDMLGMLSQSLSDSPHDCYISAARAQKSFPRREHCSDFSRGRG